VREILSNELLTLGIKDPQLLHRGVIFHADLKTAYQAHLELRTASRIQRVISEFPIHDLNSLYQHLQTIHWIDWLRPHKPFKVSLVLTDRNAMALGEEKILSALVQSVQNTSFEKGVLRFDPHSEQSIDLILFIREGQALLSVDTAGRALHKRGWRQGGHPAVLKETLAAFILLRAGYQGDETLLDPMCGSGTFAIEGAYIALHKAPLIHRGKDDFALEHLAGFDRALWRRISDQLRAAKKNELSFPIYASDIRGQYVELARAAALRARVEKYLQFSVKPFQEWEPPTSTGLLVANLPYGERIGAGEIDRLYREVGRVLKDRFSKWRIALLVPQQAPIHLLDLKVNEKVLLKNGSIPVNLLLKNPSQ
ncbi:MAG: hypothetical protein JNK65_01025, partial [Deltaproteobacteria bacterium]|nr:hypothetical protein [Deltaproteobacteria bacterium]